MLSTDLPCRGLRDRRAVLELALRTVSRSDGFHPDIGNIDGSREPIISVTNRKVGPMSGNPWHRS